MHFSLHGEPKSRLEKTRFLSEENCNVSYATREYCKAPAKAHLTMSNKDVGGEGPSRRLRLHLTGEGKARSRPKNRKKCALL